MSGKRPDKYDEYPEGNHPKNSRRSGIAGRELDFNSSSDDEHESEVEAALEHAFSGAYQASIIQGEQSDSGRGTASVSSSLASNSPQSSGNSSGNSSPDQDSRGVAAQPDSSGRPKPNFSSASNVSEESGANIILPQFNRNPANKPPDIKVQYQAEKRIAAAKAHQKYIQRTDLFERVMRSPEDFDDKLYGKAISSKNSKRKIDFDKPDEESRNFARRNLRRRFNTDISSDEDIENHAPPPNCRPFNGRGGGDGPNFPPPGGGMGGGISA